MKKFVCQYLRPFLVGFCVFSVHAFAAVQYKGINFSGGEYAGCANSGARYGYDYIYENAADIDKFIGLGANTFRVPFCWERLQPTLMGALDTAELSRLDALVSHITAGGAYIVLDLHNYARYNNTLIATGGTVTKIQFANVWQQLAAHYRSNNSVIFGLMNEPHDTAGDTWLDAANAAIAAIRNAGAKNLVLVPGVAWTGAHSWTATSYGIANSVAMLKVSDSANNFAYEVHQYLDSDSSGTTANCVDADIGVARVAAFTAWARANRAKGFLGEFAGGRNDICYSAVYNLLKNITANSDVWIGWAYWSTGPWQPNYMFNVPPQIIANQKTQLDVIRQFFDCKTAACRPSPPILKNVSPTP